MIMMMMTVRNEYTDSDILQKTVDALNITALTMTRCEHYCLDNERVWTFLP